MKVAEIFYFGGAILDGVTNSLTLDIANKSMDALWQRANVISNNISNADTPGYKEKNVTFEDALANAINSGSISANTLDLIEPQVFEVQGAEDPMGNSVNMETQMVQLAKNQLQYSYMEKAENDSLSMLRSAASEGRSL